jgi:uncharacterized protein YjbI with pentapeptide repeats
MRKRIHADEVERATQDPDHWLAFLESSDHDLSEIDFTGLYLVGLDFSQCDLEASRFRQAYVKECDFSRCNLYGSSFESAEVEDCKFTGALLSHSILDNAEFARCDFMLAEMTQASAIEASFESCDLSRARGLSQEFLDKSVGSEDVVIPQSLDYPVHWTRSQDDRRADALFSQLRAFRGDEVLLCSFDGKRLTAEQVASKEKSEVLSALNFLQKQLSYLVEEKFLHNEAPKIYRALRDYYEAITQNAGENRERWPKKLYEIDEINLGLQGNCLSAYLEAGRKDLNEQSPEKLPVLDQILSSHFLLAASLSHWRSFVDAAIDAKLRDEDVVFIEKFSNSLLTKVGDQELFDPEIPRTIKTLKVIFGRPKDAARVAAFGIVRCVESMFSAVFTFCRRFIVKSAEGLIEDGSRFTVRAVLAAIVGIGGVSLFSLFPSLATWIAGGISALRALGLMP